MKLLNVLTIYAAAKKVQKIEKSEEPFRDEVHYPRRVLDELSAAGVDVTGWKEAVLMEGKKEQRGITVANKWHETTDAGKIAIPYSFHASAVAFEAEIDDAMTAMSKDLGCMETVKVPHAQLDTNEWTNGIMFTWATVTGGGCWSALGLAPGYTGGLGDIEALGAKPEWQIVSLDSNGCAGFLLF